MCVCVEHSVGGVPGIARAATVLSTFGRNSASTPQHQVGQMLRENFVDGDVAILFNTTKQHKGPVAATQHRIRTSIARQG